MHILFATPGFVENNGPTTGFPKYLMRTAKTLLEWGHEVTVVTCSNRTVEYEFLGMNIYRVRCSAIITYGIQEKDELAQDIYFASVIHKGIEHILESKKVDIIQYTNLCGVSLFHDFNIPAVLRLSSYALLWPATGQEKRMEMRTQIEISSALKCDGVIAPSYLIADRFAKDINKKVEVIETPFILESQEINEQIYINHFEGKKYILFYGSLVEHKGLGVIADSIYAILSKQEDIYFAIIGDGEPKWINKVYRNAKEYADRIIYHPAIGFSSLIPIIKKAKFVVLPSLMENLSNACIETMGLGQIVLGCDGASFEQLIIDGVNGALCKIGATESFINKIFCLLDYCEDKMIEMRKNALKTIERLKPEYVTKQLVQYYEKMIVNHKNV